LKFKADFQSKMSVCRHELGVGFNPQPPDNSNPGCTHMAGLNVRVSEYTLQLSLQSVSVLDGKPLCVSLQGQWWCEEQFTVSLSDLWWRLIWLSIRPRVLQSCRTVLHPRLPRTRHSFLLASTGWRAAQSVALIQYIGITLILVTV